MALTVNHISLQRGNGEIFSALSFQVALGEMVQILGENGAGKTSLLRALVGLIALTEGEICWQGVAIAQLSKQYHQALIYIAHTHALRPMLSARENLLLDTRLHSHEVQQGVDETLAQLNLTTVAHLRVDCLSAGQQRRVALARLWLFKAKLWILDEPFVTLDQAGCQLLETKMSEHLRAGNMIIFTSHQSFCLPQLAVKKIWLSHE